MHCDSLFGLLRPVYLHCSIWPPLPMQHSRPTLTFKPLIVFPSTSYLFPLHPHHRLMLLAVSLCLLFLFLLPDSLRVFQWNDGDLRVRSTELLHFLSSHPLEFICIPESNLNLSASFQIPGFSALRFNCIHYRSGIFSTDVTHPSSGVIIFVKQGLSFSEHSTSFLSSLDPYSKYVGFNISPNDSSSLSFFNVYDPLFALLQRIAEPISFFLPFFPLPEISLVWRTLTVIIPSGTQEVLPTPVGRKYLIGHLL